MGDKTPGMEFKYGFCARVGFSRGPGIDLVLVCRFPTVRNSSVDGSGLKTATGGAVVGFIKLWFALLQGWLPL